MEYSDEDGLAPIPVVFMAQSIDQYSRGLIDRFQLLMGCLCK